MSYSIEDKDLTFISIPLFLKIPLPLSSPIFFFCPLRAKKKLAYMKAKNKELCWVIWNEGAFFYGSDHIFRLLLFNRSYALILVPCFCGWLLCSDLSHLGGLQLHWCLGYPTVGFKLCAYLLLGSRMEEGRWHLIVALDHA